MIDLLIEKGAVLDYKTMRRITKHGKLNLLNNFIDKSLDVNFFIEYRYSKDEKIKKMYLIHFACMWGNAATFDRLIELGADFDVLDNDGLNALHMICFLSDQDTRNKYYHCWKDFYLKPYRSGHLVIFKKLIDLGADLLNRDNEFMLKRLDLSTPLHTVIGHKNCELFWILLNCGRLSTEDVNAKACYDQTPLHRLCIEEYSDLNFYKKLIEMGADVNAKDEKGNIPYYSTLHLYLSKNTDPIAEFLCTEQAKAKADSKLNAE